MQSSTFTLDAPDGAAIHVNVWSPSGPPKAIVQVAHGMAEHADRYARFAQRLTDAGYVVYAEDHRGHGQTAGRPERLGIFADADGFNAVVADMHRLTQKAREEHPGLPVFLVGHSMGSFLSRSYAAKHGSDLTGLVLIGTAGDPGPLAVVGRGIAAAEGRFRGRTHRSTLLNKLTFGAYNKGIENPRTEFDWLSRDPAEVDKYVADDTCGFVATTGFFQDILGGLREINSDAMVSLIPKTLPIHLVSGDRDPVGANAKGVEQVADQMRRLGVKDVTVTLWPGARHEVLNETNRDEVETDIVDWLNGHQASAA